MKIPTTLDETRTTRLEALEDEIRRRLWARAQVENEQDFDRTVAELARDQYASETSLH